MEVLVALTRIRRAASERFTLAAMAARMGKKPLVITFAVTEASGWIRGVAAEDLSGVGPPVRRSGSIRRVSCSG